MKTKIAAALIAALTLSGCAATVYTRPGATKSDFDADMTACDYEVIKYGQVSSRVTTTLIGAGIEDGLRQLEVRRGCLASKGWTVQK